MQFKTLVYSALAATVAAQSLQDLIKQMPACAQTCVDTASPKIGCKLNDNACQCGKIEDLTKAALPCISSGCDQAEMQVAMKVSTQICSIVAAGGAEDKPSSGGDAKPSGPAFSNSTASSTGSAGGSKVSPSASAGASSTADPSTAGAAQNLAGLGIAAAALALAL